MSTIQDIQDELITGYGSVTLPNSLGSPTGQKHESVDGVTVANLPIVIVGRGVKLTQQHLSSDDLQITREYIVDLLCYEADESEHSVFATERNNTADCIEVIEQAFPPYGLTTTGCIWHDISADTNDTEVYLRYDNRNFIGVRFRHEITFIQNTRA